MKVKYFVGILLAMQCVIGVSTTGNGPTLTCCTKRSTTKVEVKKIKSYMYQNGPPCKIIAVRFLLFSGITICSDPEDSWAIHAMKKLDEIKTKTTRNTPPSWTSTNWTENTISTSSPEASRESTITMTTPKGTSITWTPRTYTTPRSLNNQTLGITNKSSHWTTTQVTTMMMTTRTTTQVTTMKMTTREPLTNDIKTTSMTTTTESPVTTPKGTSTIWKPTTYITHTTSTTVQPVNTRNLPQWMTTTQLTTRKEYTTTERKPVTPETKTTSMTMTTENSVAMTTPRRASPIERRVQKSSTMNVPPQKVCCPPVETTNQDKSNNTSGKTKIPWTLRRLRKKSKKGLRRAQMKSPNDSQVISCVVC